MEFTEEYFEDEVREGFFVPGMMKRSWAAQLEILEEVKKICKRHHIQYFAEWGTLLGAIRHGGMIPWDDDLDICMKRKDYEKFMEVAERELPDDYWIQSYRTRDTDNMVTKIVNYPTMVLPERDQRRFHGYPYLECIDLFVLDFIPCDPDAEKAVQDLVQMSRVVNTYIEGGGEESEDLTYILDKFEEICGVTFDREKPMERQLLIAIEMMMHQFDETDSNELTIIPYYLDNYSFRMPRVYYEEAIEVPFENTTIAVPAYYDQLLTYKYGDYMKPVRQFDTHCYPAYNVIHEEIKQQMKIEPYQYHFSKAVMEKAEEERLPSGKIRDQVLVVLSLFSEAHEELRRCLSDGLWADAQGILGECQNLAIQIGTMIEEKQGEGCVVVKSLEQYCELIFSLFEAVSSEEPSVELERIATLCDELSGYEKKLMDHVEQDLKEKKEVVFIPYKAEYWCAMESMWQKALEDEDMEVYVIPVPYYYKDDVGIIKKDEPHYEINYPDDVKITSYEEYNFETHHPDVVVTQYPYDEYSYALTIHPFFYCRNIKKYTDNLVFVPSFVMDEIEPEDERSRTTLRYYCNTPGLVHADTVIVQSEQMKDVYVELLTEFAGEDTKGIWEKKIKGVGLPISDYLKNFGKDNVDVPEEWLPILKKTDGSWKKVLIYSTSVSTLLGSGDQMIDKMKANFKVFEQSQDEIALIWHPDPRTREVLRKNHSVLWQKYRDMVQKFREDGWGIYDDSQEIERLALLCDACYGDGGKLLNACRAKGKPITLQNVKMEGCDDISGFVF